MLKGIARWFRFNDSKDASLRPFFMCNNDNYNLYAAYYTENQDEQNTELSS
jgi:hypothetical protein